MTSAEIIELALQWLIEFDQDNFSLCWRCASPELRSQVSETDFIMIMSDKRPLQGRVLSRELQDVGSEMTYYKRPELVHRVLKFDVTLAAGDKGQELVTLVKGENMTWQVANYTRL